jgi:hypothetical protein
MMIVKGLASFLVTPAFIQVSGLKKTALFPELVDTVFGFGGVIGLEEFLVHVATL